MIPVDIFGYNTVHANGSARLLAT